MSLFLCPKPDKKQIMLSWRRIEKRDADFDTCLEIYNYSFPYEERRDDANLVLSLDDRRFHFLCFSNDAGRIIGFLTFWDMGDFLYGEHFATDRSIRNSGFGSKALDVLKSFGKPVILEIEMPQDEITVRRKGFYERNGFLLNGHRHFQPLYHEDCQLLEMRVMSWPREFTGEEYERFRLAQLDIMPVPGGNTLA